MPVVLAAARDEICFPPQLPERLASDGAEDGEARDRILADALRHFAIHGLGAVDAALVNAQRAAHAGDEQEQRQWLSICAMFDRRAAVSALTRR
jgi:hypothetical protein